MTTQESFTQRLDRLERKMASMLRQEAAAAVNGLPVQNPSGTQSMSRADLLSTCRTGDLILWSGSTGISRVIRFLTHSAFSHASIVFRGALNGIESSTTVVDRPRLFQSTWSTFAEDVEGDHELVGEQVMLNDLVKVLKGNEAEGESAPLRRLQCNDECRSALHALLATFIHTALHDPYPGADRGAPDPTDFIQGLLQMPKKY